MNDPTTLVLRVALSTIGTFHTFDMARQLEKANALASIHTGYPRFKLGDTGIPARKIHSFPWMQGPFMAGWVPQAARRAWEHWSAASFEAFVAATLPECDVYCGLSGSAWAAGRRAQARGARYVCDRGSSHIRVQDRILREEHERWGIAFDGVDVRAIAREEREYAQADAILLPSSFARRSFVEQGVPEGKLRLAPYGVDLSRFAPGPRPAEGAFDCLFVGGLSVRKGAGYLFAAYEKLQHPRKSLSIAGNLAPQIMPMLEKFIARHPEVRLLGHLPQATLKDVMSRSHVLVLPSVEEGLALVQAQAMACGCPVVASRHTGAEDLFASGTEGFIVPARDVDAMVAALQTLADDPARRAGMAEAALRGVRRIGGWDSYGRSVLDVFRSLRADPPPARHLSPKPQ
jgi:glycosyltransferase involved in cell wall biosynthesis